MMFLRLPDDVVADWLEDTEYDSNGSSGIVIVRVAV